MCICFSVYVSLSLCACVCAIGVFLCVTAITCLQMSLMTSSFLPTCHAFRLHSLTSLFLLTCHAFNTNGFLSLPHFQRWGGPAATGWQRVRTLLCRRWWINAPSFLRVFPPSASNPGLLWWVHGDLCPTAGGSQHFHLHAQSGSGVIQTPEAGRWRRQMFWSCDS